MTPTRAPLTITLPLNVEDALRQRASNEGRPLSWLAQDFIAAGLGLPPVRDRALRRSRRSRQPVESPVVAHATQVAELVP